MKKSRAKQLKTSLASFRQRLYLHVFIIGILLLIMIFLSIWTGNTLTSIIAIARFERTHTVSRLAAKAALLEYFETRNDQYKKLFYQNMGITQSYNKVFSDLLTLRTSIPKNDFIRIIENTFEEADHETAVIIVNRINILFWHPLIKELVDYAGQVNPIGQTILDLANRAMNTDNKEQQEILSEKIRNAEIDFAYYESSFSKRCSDLANQVSDMVDYLYISMLLISVGFVGLTTYLLSKTFLQQAVNHARDLESSRDQFLNLIQGSVQGVLIHQDHKPLFVNEKWAAIHGYTVEEVLAMPSIVPLIASHDHERLVDYKNQRIQGETPPTDYEYQALHKDGSHIWLENRTSMVRWEGKTAIQSTVYDITERKRALTELQESRNRFKELAELLPETIFEIALDGVVTFVNRNAFDHFRYTEEDFRQGLNAFDMIAPKDRSRAMKNMKQIQSGENLGLTEYQALRKDGTTFPALFHSTPITRGGNSVGIRGFIIDISEKKKLENQLLQAQKMESIGTLAGGIAHDFNNILSSIIGFTELALGEVEKESPVEESLREVYVAGNRAKELVKQILAFARKTEEEAKPVKLQTIAEEITHLLRSSIPASIEIITKFDSIGLIMGNATQLHQIIMNLCTNAAHAMEEKGGILTISTKDVDFDQTSMAGHLRTHEKRYVRFQVTDTGTGIPAEILDSIFEPYFTTKKTGEGTGMGLAMVQGIVESYGGHITVNSTLGEGSTFTIHLPLTAQSATQREHEPETLPTGTERILIVDDEAPIAKMSSLMLEGLGYQVTARLSSTDALELFKVRAADFDLVITDMTMPDMSGDALAIELMKIRSEIPVILCTGYSKRISVESAYGLGIKALVNKPFVRMDLAMAVRNVLDENKTV